MKMDYYNNFNFFIFFLLMIWFCVFDYNFIISKICMLKYIFFIVKGRLVKSDKFYLCLEDF